MTTGGEGMSRKIGRGIGWSAGGNVVLRVASFLSTVVMAHLIAPHEYGVFAVALTVWTIVGTLAEFGLGTDLIRAKDVATRIPTIATLGLVASSLFGLTMIAAARPLATMFRAPQAAGVIAVMAISLLVFGFSIVPAAILQREYRQGTAFAINLAGALGSITTMVTLASLGQGAAALAWGQIVNQVVIVTLLYAATRTRLRLGFDQRIARTALRFCGPLAVANLLSWVLLSVDNLIVAELLGPTKLGLYALAFNVSSWPMTAVGTSLRVVALPAFSQARGAARNRALEVLGGPLWTIAILMGLTLATLASPTIRLLYGERWLPAATALAGLGAFGALRVVFDMLATFLIAVGRSGWVLGVQAWWLAVMAPSMWFGVHSFGLAGAGWTHAIVAAVAVLPAYLWLLQRIGVDVRHFMRRWLAPTMVAIPTAALCWYAGSRIEPPVAALLLGGLAALTLYVVPQWRRWIAQVRQLGRVAAPLPISGLPEQVTP